LVVSGFLTARDQQDLYSEYDRPYGAADSYHGISSVLVVNKREGLWT
jgi:hypothetical protein